MNKKHLLIKILMVLFLVCYLGLLYTSDNAKNIPIDQISAAMEETSSVTALSKKGRVDLKRFYQIEEKDTDGYFFYKAESPMAVDEILIVKAPDRGQADSFLEAVRSHLSSQKNIFEGYGTDQMALLNNAVTERRGNYVYYMCGADAAAWRKKLLSLI
ncbi:MAG: DUF4358 domain-containing protein [Eubacteriales bacterium]|nr:DUF4358 domain-containing protein [Eubacteriales bacterium]